VYIDFGLTPVLNNVGVLWQELAVKHLMRN